ncbi:MAG: Abi family protein [Mycoplasmatales bacterium]
MSEYLSVNEQIKFLINHGMTFQDMSQDEAKSVLMHYTYYHKVMSYKHFFSIYRQDANGNDIFNGLDFNDIYELQMIDRKLRALLNDICLDIEYYFKVYILKQIEFSIVPREAYFYYDIVDLEKRYHITDKMNKRAKDYDDAYSIKMLKNYPDKKPIWVLNEYLSFGEVIEIFAKYNRKKNLTKDDFMIDLLSRAKNMRNITVHNNQLFSTKIIKVNGAEKLVKAYEEYFGINIKIGTISNHFVLNLLSTILIYAQLAPRSEFEENIDKVFQELHTIIKKNKIFDKYPNGQVIIDLNTIYKIVNKLY